VGTSAIDSSPIFHRTCWCVTAADGQAPDGLLQNEGPAQAWGPATPGAVAAIAVRVSVT